MNMTLFVTGSEKTRHNSTFFKFYFITFYNLHTVPELHKVLAYSEKVVKLQPYIVAVTENRFVQ